MTYRNLSEFYKSSEWENFRNLVILSRLTDQGETICAHCQTPIVKKYDIVVHHRVALTEANVHDYNLALNPDNVELVHFRCHNKHHRRFGYEQHKKVYLVYGSPCAGKSKFVQENQVPGDLILDMDRLWQAISGLKLYDKPKRLQRNVFELRDCLMHQVRTRLGMWQTAWVIGCYPLKMERERLAYRLGAEILYIDSTYDECIGRARNEDWMRYINEWWESYQA